MLSMWHEGVYHATKWCQAASLPLTPQGLRGLKKACLIKGQKTGCCFAFHVQGRVVGRRASWSGYSRSMPVLSCYKRGSLIGFFLDPQRENDSHPDIGQRPDGHTVAFAFAALAGLCCNAFGRDRTTAFLARWARMILAMKGIY